MSPVLIPRQDDIIFEDGHRGWWYSPTAQIVKWSILGAIILFFVVWFVGGYMHAKSRLRKGLPPLKYHRFLVPDHQKGKQPPFPRNDFTFYQAENEQYQMNQVPAPAYDTNSPLPPTYAPPEGASKVAPNQSYDVPPPGAPPGWNLSAELPPREPKPRRSLASKAGKLMPKFGRK